MEDSIWLRFKKFIESKRPIYGYFIVVIIPSAVIICALNLLLNNSNSSCSIEKEAENYALAGNFERAEKKYFELIQKEPYKIEYHRSYIQNHFAQPKTKSKNHYRDDNNITNYYRVLKDTINAKLRDIAYYGLGLIESHLSNYNEAIAYFSKIQNDSLAYFNNSYGFCLWQIGKFDESEYYFRREIESGKNIEGAVANISQLYLEQRKYGKIRILLSDSKLTEFVPERIQRITLIDQNEYGLYLKKLSGQLISRITIDGFIASLLILTIWLAYFIFIDIFESEKLRFLFLTLGFGMLSALLCTILYDSIDYSINFRTNGIWFNDLAYFIVVVGLVEEFVKILPLLAILRFSSLVNESIDYLIYAAISALGFAFMENLLYFDPSGIYTIAGRAFSAVIIHIALSSLAAYGLILSGRKKHRYPKWIYFPFFFLSACIIHGLYDFFLSGKGQWEQLAPFSFILLIYLIFIFGKILNNALNLSSFYSENNVSKLHNLSRFLSYSLSYILLLQYLIIAARYGVKNANINILVSILFSYGLLMIITISLGRFKIKKNVLYPIYGK